MTRTDDRRLDFVLLPAGFLVWSIGFAVLYAVHALGCEAGLHHLALGPTTLLRLALAVLWLTALAATGAIAAWTLRRAQRDTAMLPRAACAASIAAFAAMAWTGSPVAVLTLCR